MPFTSSLRNGKVPGAGGGRRTQVYLAAHRPVCAVMEKKRGKKPTNFDMSRFDRMCWEKFECPPGVLQMKADAALPQNQRGAVTKAAHDGQRKVTGCTQPHRSQWRHDARLVGMPSTTSCSSGAQYLYTAPGCPVWNFEPEGCASTSRGIHNNFDRQPTPLFGLVVPVVARCLRSH